MHPTAITFRIAPFALLLALSAPAFAAEDDAPRCSTVVEERNRRLNDAYREALTSGDIERAYSFWATGATVTVNGTVPYAGTYGATDPAYLETLNAYWTDNQTGSATPTIYADCDKVILVGRWIATARSSGLRVEQPIIEVFTYDRDGRMVDDQFYFSDTAVIDAALAEP